MEKRTIPEIPIYRGKDREMAIILNRIRESLQKVIDSDFITENDIYCRDLILSGDSIYLGSKRDENKISVRDGQLEFNDEVVGAAGGGAVVSVNGETGVVVLDKTDIGLGNVTNDAQVKASEKGAVNGVCDLDGSGKVPADRLSISSVTIKGSWDADTNDPELSDGGGGGITGDCYIVSVAGTTEIDGISVWNLGDWIVNTGSAWVKVDNTQLVTSVAGKQGVVTLVPGDVGLGNVPNLDTTDAVNHEHEHTNQAILNAIEEALTTTLKNNYDSAVTNSHTHSNKATLDAIQEALTSALKTNYDTAYTNNHIHGNKGQLDLVTDGDHDVRTDNPHLTTKTHVGLSDVTNDAQLKRADGDINSFTVKGSPVSADVLLIEDSAASFAKKKITIGTLPGGGGGLSHAQVMARVAMGF